jgi:hypothetical protein
MPSGKTGQLRLGTPAIVRQLSVTCSGSHTLQLTTGSGRTRAGNRTKLAGAERAFCRVIKKAPSRQFAILLSKDSRLRPLHRRRISLLFLPTGVMNVSGRSLPAPLRTIVDRHRHQTLLVLSLIEYYYAYMITRIVESDAIYSARSAVMGSA